MNFGPDTQLDRVAGLLVGWWYICNYLYLHTTPVPMTCLIAVQFLCILTFPPGGGAELISHPVEVVVSAFCVVVVVFLGVINSSTVCHYFMTFL